MNIGKLVDRFLLMEVSTMLAAAPELVLGVRPRRTNAQVAAEYLAPDAGRERQRMQTTTDLPGCCGVTG